MTGRVRRRPGDAQGRVLVAVAVLTVVAAALGVALAGRRPPAAAASLQFGWQWVALLAAFGVAEVVVVRLRVLQHEQTVTIAELPFVLGLLVLEPDTLVAVRVAGALLAFVLVRRRLSLKVLFNAALWAAEAAVAAAVLAALPVAGWGPVLWLSVLAAVVAGPGLLSSVATTIVIGLFEGRVDAAAVARAGAEQVVTTAVLVVPSVLVLDVLRGTPSGAVLVLPTLVLMIAVYRYVATLHERHAALVRVHAFTHELSQAAEPKSVLHVVLAQVLVLLGVTHVEVSVRADADGTVLAAALDRDGSLSLRTITPSLGDAADRDLLPPPPHPVTGLEPRRLRRRVGLSGGAPGDVEWLARRRLTDAIIAPLPAAGGPIGMLIAAAAPGEVRSFSSEDVHLLASVGEQVSVALRHAELLEQLRHASDHDPLTGLGNRELLHRSADAALAVATTSVLSVDLDGFKEVNDVFGHAHGDAILVQVGHRLAGLLPSPAVPARLGGDEFAVLLPGMSAAEALAVAVALRTALEQPVVVGSDVLAVGASVGVATVARDTSPAVLLHRADLAMYAAKRSDHGPRAWEPRLEGRRSARTPLLGELRKALAAGEIAIALQPQIESAGGRLVAIEALVRWTLEGIGPISPEQLVATAERGGMMTELTLYVLDRALAALVVLERDGHRLDVSVNLSTRDLSSPRLVPGVVEMLAKHGLPAGRLTLELTETGLLEDFDRAAEVFGELKRVGVRLSLDDFGTGWSSLQQVQRLPFDEIKVDRSFVGDVVGGRGAGAIVRSVLDLGRNLGMRVVAEGVEDAETLAWLADAGCDRSQGYHIARPLALHDLGAFAAARPSMADLSGLPGLPDLVDAVAEVPQQR